MKDIYQAPSTPKEPTSVGSKTPLAEYKETRELVQLVTDGADLLRLEGEKAFAEFRRSGSRWRQEETYIFILDLKGNMLVHPDSSMEGKSEIDLTDINGKLIVRGLISAATAVAGKPEGWYHYQWPVPHGLLPRWKSTYVRLVTTASGARYVIGSGMYNDRMERTFVVDLVKDAVAQIEKHGDAAFRLFHDPTSSFIAKDAYIFVIDPNGVDLVNPGFANLEGRNILDVTDVEGKHLIRDMLDVVQTQGSGWVDYMWPKPGESVSTQKSAYVCQAKVGNGWVLVGCGVYLADAPKAKPITKQMTAAELMGLVREAAALLEERGEKALPEFRKKGSKWFRDETYLFVQTLDGLAAFHAAQPEREGRDENGLQDVLGRPFVRMFQQAAAAPGGEGWVHYMYPEPGNIFPKWKSTFVKRVTFPSGKSYLVGCGIYNMRMDKAFVEDLVNHAATLLANRGKEAFGQLGDKRGSFVFMDTYVFVLSTDGTQLVNPAQPSLEGKNLIDHCDVNGKAVVREEIAAALREGSAWADCYWYKPGDNVPARKETYVRKVDSGEDIYIVGSGVYLEEERIS